ncbi:MAG: NlpC/P60 family protein [Vulcanimicrobiota bacterium]
MKSRLPAWRLVLVILLSSLAWGAPTRARVAVPVASVHRAPAAASERVTQAFLWDRVVVLDARGSWSKVLVVDQYRTPHGYPGWVLSKQLWLENGPAPTQYCIVARSRAGLRAEPGSKRLMEVYLGTRLPLAEPVSNDEKFYRVRLPGQQATLLVAAEDITFENPEARGSDILRTAWQLKGTSYLWGGMSAAGIDCSGLVYAAYRVHGYTLPRDADQQFLVGEKIDEDELEAGDLVFFGATADEITHVGIYRGDSEFIHASSGGGVTTGTLEADYYSERFQGGRRILRSGLSEPQVEVP